MTRYTSVEHPESFQGSRRFALASSRQTARAHPVGQHILPMQTDPENLVEKQRRRIAVACSRCRKRKIKCSGDPKNGLGCQNCRNAGTEPGQCQFLRVQSSSVEFGSTEWPYLLNGPPSFPTPQSIGMYGGGAGATPYPTNSIPTRRMPPSWPYSYPPIPATVECFGYDLPSHDALFEQPCSVNHSTQGYMLHENTSGQQVYHPELMRQWQIFPKGERGPSAIFEQIPPIATYNTSGSDYPSPLAPITSIDPTSGFPSMGALAKSLPPSQHNQVNDRVLPTPRAGPEASPNIPQQGPYLELYGQNATARTLVPWTQHPERPNMGGSHSIAVPASNSSSSSDGSLTSSHDITKSLSSSPHAHDPQLGYTCEAMTSSSSSAACTDAHISTAPIAAADFMLSMDGPGGIHVTASAAADSAAILYAPSVASNVPPETRHSHPHQHDHLHSHHPEPHPHHHLRSIIPSSGSFGFSPAANTTEGAGSKNRPISSSGADGTLLHLAPGSRPGYMPGHHNHDHSSLGHGAHGLLRPIQPASSQEHRQQKQHRLDLSKEMASGDCDERDRRKRSFEEELD